jgi:hypothetical protein
MLKPCTWPYRTSALRLVAEVMFAPFASFVSLPIPSVARGGRSDGLIGTGVEDVGGFRVTRGNEAAVMDTSVGVTVTFVLACFPSRAGTLPERQEAAFILIPTTLTGTGGDQLAVQGNAHAPLGWVTREGGLGGHDAVGHQPVDQAVLAGQQPVQFGVPEGLAEGRLSRYIVGVEAQAQTVAQAALLGMEFGHQRGPSPTATANQQPGQPYADRIEGRRTQVAGETLAQDRTPRTEVEHADDQIEVVEAAQIVGGPKIVWGKPAILRATETGTPGADSGGNYQLQREKRADGFPLKSGDQVWNQQPALRGRNVPRRCQSRARQTAQPVKGALRYSQSIGLFHRGNQDHAHRCTSRLRRHLRLWRSQVRLSA